MNPTVDQQPVSGQVDRQPLVDLVIVEYRSMVVRRPGMTAEWRVLERTYRRVRGFELTTLDVDRVAQVDWQATVDPIANEVWS